jgi:hypothetical protein
VRARTFFLLFALLSCAIAPALAQEGIRLPARPSAGIDPSFAGGWLAPERERLGLAQYHWRDSIGFAPSQRLQWSYAFTPRSSFGMSMASGRDFIAEPVYGVDVRQYGLIGRYSLAPDWSLSAETLSRDPGSLFRLQDLRIGLRRQF